MRPGRSHNTSQRKWFPVFPIFVASLGMRDVDWAQALRPGQTVSGLKHWRSPRASGRLGFGLTVGDGIEGAARQAFGSMVLILRVSIRDAMHAQVWPPSSNPTKRAPPAVQGDGVDGVCNRVGVDLDMAFGQEDSQPAQVAMDSTELLAKAVFGSDRQQVTPCEKCIGGTNACNEVAHASSSIHAWAVVTGDSDEPTRARGMQGPLPVSQHY